MNDLLPADVSRCEAPLDSARLVEKWPKDVHTALQRPVIFAETFDDHGFRLLYNAKPLDSHDDYNNYQKSKNDNRSNKLFSFRVKVNHNLIAGYFKKFHC